jgi:hypothetical protein
VRIAQQTSWLTRCWGTRRGLARKWNHGQRCHAGCQAPLCLAGACSSARRDGIRISSSCVRLRRASSSTRPQPAPLHNGISGSGSSPSWASAATGGEARRCGRRRCRATGQQLRGPATGNPDSWPACTSEGAWLGIALIASWVRLPHATQAAGTYLLCLRQPSASRPAAPALSARGADCCPNARTLK